MSGYGVRIDRFSAGLDELTRKQQRSFTEVLRVLDRTKRFSIFEATENQVIARTMDGLTEQGLINVTPQGYPWSAVELTDAGRGLLEKTKDERH
jgi:hypothetical protein